MRRRMNRYDHHDSHEFQSSLSRALVKLRAMFRSDVSVARPLGSRTTVCPTAFRRRGITWRRPTDVGMVPIQTTSTQTVSSCR